MALTKRQKQVLDFISQFMDEHGYSPSYQEIAAGLGLASLATVHKHLQALETKHYLRKNFNQSRSLDLAPKYFQEERRRHGGASPLLIPLAGRIAAGMPVESVAGQDTINLADFAGDADAFALQVRGDSMIEDHICDGDIVLVERTDTVRDGEIVVALVRGFETTLKRFYRKSDTTAMLKPANSAMTPIVVALDELQIQGRLLAVLRKYK
jgi:repressor LexA